MKSSRVYVPRKVRVNLAGNDNVVLTAGMVATALGKSASTLADTCTFKLRGMKVWNASPAATNSNYLSVRLSTTSTLLTSQLVTGEDYGNASHLPGVRLTVPDQLAKSLETVNASNSTGLATLSGYPTGTGSTQNFCVDVSVWVADEDSA